jgi:DNA repair protein RadC
LAILLRTGSKGLSVIELAGRILEENGTLGNLATKSVDSLTKTTGVGKDKAATLAAAFELNKRVAFQKKWFSNNKITSPSDVAEIFMPLLRDEVKEKFIVVCLNTANKIIKYEIISVGNLNTSIVHPREVFRVAIDNSSANIIILHNHPSGNPEPSNEDISITKKLKEAGRILDIQLFDHIIIAGDTYTSLVEKKVI